jgi:hypothetical protein
MALSATVLAGLMRENMDALSDAEKADRNKTLQALAEAVVQHITEAAVMTLGPDAIAVAAMAGGPGVLVTGTGTIS